MDEGELGVDGGGADAAGLDLVLVGRGEGLAILRVLVAVEKGLEVDAGGVVDDAPDAEEVNRGDEEVGAEAVVVGDEYGLGLEGKGGQRRGWGRSGSRRWSHRA